MNDNWKSFFTVTAEKCEWKRQIVIIMISRPNLENWCFRASHFLKSASSISYLFVVSEACKEEFGKGKSLSSQVDSQADQF